jgi:hypothetical protein
MALKTNGANVLTDKQESIRRPMGSVTDRTPFRLDRGVLENPWTPLFGVTIKADIVIKLIPFLQAGPGSGPVRRVTVNALHGALDDPVIVWKIEFCLNVKVTGETKIVLFGLQKVLGDLGSMDTVAVIASDGA